MKETWVIILTLIHTWSGQTTWVNGGQQKCKVMKTAANCTRRHLSTVPKYLTANITCIDLSRNIFIKISADAFTELTHLRSIDLSHNKIQEFDKTALGPLKRLQILNLSWNQLPLTVDWCTNNKPFGLAPGLTLLNLKANLKAQNYEYLGECLYHLKSLKGIYIDGANNASFSPGISELVGLKTLDLSQSPNLTKLDSPVFDNLRNLSLNVLKLASCNITAIGRDTFVPLAHLTELDLSTNSFLTIKGAVFYRIPKSLKVLRINHVQNDDSGVYIKTSWFQYLNRSGVERLFMDSNGISEINEKSIKALPAKLKVLSVQHNTLHMDFINRLSWLPNLQVFDAYCQQPRKSVVKTIAAGTKRPSRETDEGAIDEEIWVKLPFERKVNSTVKLPRNLKTLRLTFTGGLKLTSSCIHFSQNKLTTVDVSHNNLGEVSLYVLNLNSMKKLDLSFNQLELPDTRFFIGLKNLEVLNLANNDLESSLSTDTGCNLFKPLTKLRNLFLSFNGITSLKTCTFSSMINLSTLVLTFNRILHLEARLGHMFRLHMLDLRGNLIPYFEDQIIDDLVKISEHTDVRIRLGNNSLVCNCDSLHFLQWAHHTKSVSLSRDLTCRRIKTSQPLPMRQIDKLLRQLERKCRSYVELIVGISLAIMTALLVVSVGLVYRYRWKLRYFYYMVVLQRKRRKDGYHQIDGSDNCDFEYDLFVSYADDDRAFVINDMINVLEKGKGIRLCVHHRDFMAGDEIAANVTRAIHSSRKTVMLLSENFLNSYWCMYEFNMVRMEAIYNGRDVLLVIMFTPVKASNMPYEILHHVQTNSYLERPHGEELAERPSQEDMELFWEKLVQSILRP